MKCRHQDVAKTGHFQLLSKTEDSEYLLQHPTKEKLQAGLMCSDYLSLSFGCSLLVLAPGVSSGFMASAALNRIRGFRDLNSVIL